MFLLLTVFSCQTGAPDDDEENALNVENGNSSNNGNWANSSENSRGPTGRRPTHPTEATAWDTRKLLLSSKLPSVDLLNSCQEELRSLASDAGSQEDLLRLEKNLRSAAARNPELYHWCFYRIATLIDWSLEKDEGILPRDKMPRFFTRMKGLWALARALDNLYGTKLYFSYIQIRYMQISKDYFGRPLEVFTSPLGDVRKINKKNKEPKAAGEFDDEDDF